MVKEAEETTKIINSDIKYVLDLSNKIAELNIEVANSQDRSEASQKEIKDRQEEQETILRAILAKFTNGFRSEIKDYIDKCTTDSDAKNSAMFKGFKTVIWQVFWAIAGLALATTMAIILAVLLV